MTSMMEKRIDALKTVDKRLMFSVMYADVTRRYLTTAYYEKKTSWLDDGMIEMRERIG